jgi:hypothetical protein
MASKKFYVSFVGMKYFGVTPDVFDSTIYSVFGASLPGSTDNIQ